MGLRAPFWSTSYWSRNGIVASLLVCLGINLAAAKDDDAPPAADDAVSQTTPTGKYLRLLRDDDKRPVELQTAVVRFEPADEKHRGLSIDLIAAVHIGEQSYYGRLNERFRDYDALLYELVAPEGTRVPKGGVKSTHPVSLLQRSLKDFLDLDFQLDHVDYQPKNFVHADMTPKMFEKSMKDRGETVWTLLLRALGQSMAQEPEGDGWGDVRMLMALIDKNRALQVKRLLAEQFEDLEGIASAFDSADGSTLVTERNKRALQVLRKEIASGKRRLAIFYGAAHMPDMARRLMADLNVQPVQEEWLTAWDLHEPVKTKPRTEKNAKEKDRASKEPAKDTASQRR